MIGSRQIIYVLIGGMLATPVACVSLQSDDPIAPGVSPISSSSPEEVTGAEDVTASRAQPDTKIITMNLEGEPTEVELKLLNQSPVPFTTYYPAEGFMPEINTSRDGTTVRFYFSPTGTKDEDAYISFFFPNRSTSVEAIQNLILGEQGVLVRNQWELVDRTDIVSYPWAKEKLLYQHKDGADAGVGAIYVGQDNGEAFYTLTHYPVEYGDGFEPRSNIVLENLQF